MRSPNTLMTELGFHPSRQMGQNFLKYPEIADNIVNWAQVSSQAVIEIGPGLGALTEALLRSGKSVVAVEKDKRLFAYLSQTYGTRPELRLIQADALTLDFETLCKEHPGAKHIFSNLPYAISTPLIERFLRARTSLEGLTLLVQEELALRMAATVDTSDYGRLAIWMQTLGDVRLGPRIPRTAFAPKPKVESRLVQILLRPSPLIPEGHLEAFLNFVAQIFSFRRKMLRKVLALARLEINLSDHPHLEEVLSQRSEQLSIAQLYEIYQIVCKNGPSKDGQMA